MIERALMVAGLGFGDEGKGSVVDWLTRVHRATTVVRYNGGSQAAHHVVTSDGRTHCFAQFGAGTLVSGVRTFLSRFMIVDPLALAAEERALRRIGVTDAYRRLFIDPRCVIVTPFHRIVNQLRELARGEGRHGSCGLGIGEARLDSEQPLLPSIRVADTLSSAQLRRRLKLLWLSKLDQAEQLVDEHQGVPGMDAALHDLRRPDRLEGLVDAYGEFAHSNGIAFTMEPTREQLGPVVIFEGAQGVLLDREHGFWPHVTPSRTTFAHALTVLDELGGAGYVDRVGVLRAYATRHGAGPLPTEDDALGIARPDAHNRTDPWQGGFRLGWFDSVLGRYAVRVIGGVDLLMVTNLDRLAGLSQVRLCTGYHGQGAGVSAAALSGDAGATVTREERTHQLARCQPVYAEFSGWRSAPTEGIVPSGAREFLNALQSPASMDMEIFGVSLGPSAAGKQIFDSMSVDSAEKER